VIISHKHRFIFFAVPKTATHAVRQALRTHLAAGDWEQQTLFGEQYLPIPELAAMKHGHISARQLKHHLPQGTWDSYFKFGFVRNPFDRFVSACFFLNRGVQDFQSSAGSFMKQAVRRPRFQQRALGRPQAHYLCDHTGEIAVDYVGRYESLQASFDHICKEIGISSSNLSRKNASEHDSYAKYYDKELRDLVADFYRDDLRLFAYEWER